MRTTLIAGLLVVLAAGVGAGDITKYKITSKHDEHTDFARFKTYVWEPGWQSYDKTAHEQIVAAVDRELSAIGFTQAASGPADVAVVYALVRRSDVDLKSKARTPEGERPQFPVASLLVMIREPDTHRELFRVRSDVKISMEPDAIARIIDEQVAAMFTRYPYRTPAAR